MEAITTTPANRTNQTGENPDISGVLGVLVGDVVPTGVSVAVPLLGVAVGVESEDVEPLPSPLSVSSLPSS
jgi:hypothetical protein